MCNGYVYMFGNQENKNGGNSPEEIAQIEVPDRDEADHVAGSIQDQMDHWEGERQLDEAEKDQKEGEQSNS